MGVKLSRSLLERDVKMEQMALGSASQKMAKARKSGAGIGGFLGGLLGVALAPFTGGLSLVATAGLSALGAAAGSKIGESQSGVSMEDDIMGGKFMKNSRGDIVNQLEAQTTGDIIGAGISGAMNFGTMSAGMDAFKGGFKAAAGAGKKGLLGSIGGGIKGLGSWAQKSLVPDLIKKKTGLDFKNLGGAGAKELAEKGTKEIVGGVAEQGMAGSVLKSIGQTGKNLYGSADYMLGGLLPGGSKSGGPMDANWGSDTPFGENTIYGGVDKVLGGMLPGGQNVKEGWIGGLLGSQGDQSSYGGDSVDLSGGLGGTGYDDVSYDMSSPDLSNQDFAAQHAANVQEDVGINLDRPDFTNPEWVKQFQMRVMGMQEGDSGWGQFGPMTTEAYQNWKYNQQGN